MHTIEKINKQIAKLEKLKEELRTSQTPEIVLNSKNSVAFKNLKLVKMNKQSLIFQGVDGSEYLMQVNPHKNGITGGPRLPVKRANG
jgi:hypothetical protein